MLKHDQKGAITGLAIGLIVCIVLLVGALGFGGWAFSSRQDYKNNVDSKINEAVASAKATQQKTDQAEAAEEAKNPLQTYNGPEPYGSVMLQFPKTWSAYVSDRAGNGSDGNTPVDGYFHPAIVPLVSDANSIFSLRVQVVNQSYSEVLQSYNDALTGGKATFTAYALPKVPSVVGVRVKGTLNVDNAQKPVDMIVLPVRSNTLLVWTEGSQFENDFNTYILPNLSFSK